MYIGSVDGKGLHHLVWKSSITPWMRLIIIGREIAISALREWMAKVGQAKSVAVAFVGKLKTVAQMIAIPLLLFRDRLWGLIACFWDHPHQRCRVLTVVSMLYYLRKALPYASVRG